MSNVGIQSESDHALKVKSTMNPIQELISRNDVQTFVVVSYSTMFSTTSPDSSVLGNTSNCTRYLAPLESALKKKISEESQDT